MNKRIILSLCLAASFSMSAMAQHKQYEEEVTFWKERIKTLSSDEFGGRKPLTEYETKTINYIADEFQKLGLQPANNGSYFQPVREISTLARPDKNRIRVKAAKGSMDLNFPDDIVVWTHRGQKKMVVPNTDFVFVGFGINAPEYGWNDYEGIDVKGKIVIAMVNDPGFYDKDLFRGRNMTYYGRWTYKLEEAKRQGAAGALVLHNTAAASYGWNVCSTSHVNHNIALCSEDLNADALAFEGWLHEEAAKKLFEISGLNFDEVTSAAKKKGFKSFTMKAKSKVTMNVLEMNVGESHNVAAVLPGTDLKDEYIVCTAHWDHLGIGTPIEGDSIYNGAADNASGTAALMVLAKKFQQLPVKPRRSIVFLAVTSEECGLLGSEGYCENPLFPLSKTAANLNFDGTAPAMRTTGVTLRAAGKTDMDALVLAAAAAQGRSVRVVTEDPAGGFFRSDHFNFVKKGVPTVLCGGGGEVIDKARQAAKPKRYTYHQPNDEYREDEWDFDGAIENLNLMFSIGLMIANQDEMPKWAKDADFQRQPDKK